VRVALGPDDPVWRKLYEALAGLAAACGGTFAVCFAAIYAVVVWFNGSFDPAVARARIRRALPEIEVLTLALPPSGGPGCDEGAEKLRA